MKSDIIIGLIKEIHFDIVKEIKDQIFYKQSIPKRGRNYFFEGGDVSYDIDIKAEKIILQKIEEKRLDFSINLVMEGIDRRYIEAKNNKKPITIIFDPIDGTREIMYNKRSAWILTGVAFIENPKIKDIEIAIQTEIPTFKQNFFSHIFSVKGNGAFEEIYDKYTFQSVNKRRNIVTSSASNLRDGYVCFPNPFPGTKIQISKVYETFYKKNYPSKHINDAKVFSDEYISTGGQIYLLATGCYRIVVDIRDFVQKEKNSLCCHPYDLCTVLIAKEAGAEIINLQGKELDYPLDTNTNCNWVGFANKKLKRKYEKTLFESIFTFKKVL